MTEGIFHQIALNNTFEFITDTISERLDIDYYLSHSGKKKISNLYENLVKYYPDENPLVKLAKIIESRFKNKWDRLYEVLIEAEYNPIENYSMEEIETPNLEDKRVTKVSQEMINETELNDYGFNSPDPVPTSHNLNKLKGDGDKNKTDETINRTGTRTLTRKGNIGVTTSQQMIQSSIDLYSKSNFIDIIFKDVDSVLCLSIY